MSANTQDRSVQLKQRACKILADSAVPDIVPYIYGAVYRSKIPRYLSAARVVSQSKYSVNFIWKLAIV